MMRSDRSLSKPLLLYGMDGYDSILRGIVIPGRYTKSGLHLRYVVTSPSVNHFTGVFYLIQININEHLSFLVFFKDYTSFFCGSFSCNGWRGNREGWVHRNVNYAEGSVLVKK